MNVRLSEGGAAGVARTLADELEMRGISSPFAYGYSTGGRNSPMDQKYGATRVTPASIAAANRIAYSLIGRETRLRGRKHWEVFERELEAADVIHLHAIHSHIVDTEALFGAIINANKPVVWTLHDQWAMTGRCAQPGTCRLWEIGCPKCPSLNAYPPARIDNAARRWHERRAVIEKLQETVPTAIVACASWLGIEAERSSLQNVSVIKNSVDREFWRAAEGGASIPRHGNTRNLFMCRDLRDPQKVNWGALGRIAKLENQSLTIVGDNAPHDVVEATHLPSISNRVELAETMRRHDRLIFTSQVDYFPLTIVEALTAGMVVYAVDSPAAQEFAASPQIRIFEHVEAMVSTLQDDGVRPDKAPLREPQIHEYAPARMTDDYVALYQRLVGA